MADSGDTTPKPSFLVVETTSMEQTRRSQEQQGLRAHLRTRVHERDRAASNDLSAEASLEMGDALKQHPLLTGQQFDGIDVNPSDPNLSPAAREKVKEIQRKQQLDKQLRLEQRLELQMSNRPRHSPRFNPKPGGP